MSNLIFHFWAQFSRLRFVKRWSIKYNHTEEDCLQHSAEVASVAHALAVIRNHLTNSNELDANKAGMIGLYHDMSESITGDVITPAKKADPIIENAFKEIESRAERVLIDLLPGETQGEFKKLVISEQIPENYRIIVKEADVIAAYTKCKREVALGNPEFKDALIDIENRLKEFAERPEVMYFLKHALPSYTETIDSQLTNGISAK
tara:strand:- start:20754 stop:21371 length:618 start_codon:yes stop_codon:yes gene_type:complete